MYLISSTESFVIAFIICSDLLRDVQNLSIKGKTKVMVDFHSIHNINKLLDDVKKSKKNSKSPQVHDLGYDFTEEEIEKFKIWRRGEIPYFIDEFSFDKVLRDRLRKFLDEASALTGLHFLELPRPPEDDQGRWVLFINRRGLLTCQDHTHKSFTNIGVQRVVVGYDCAGAAGGGLEAAVLALAGVPPQHNAPDRDDYIKIRTENIIPDKRHMFKALSNKDWLFHDIFPYDFYSAGHYSSHMYSVNGSATIEPTTNHELPQEGEITTFSNGDIFKVHALYHYIQHKDKNKFSGCSSIFKPGKNFSNYEPDQDILELKPREKPAKYLGKNKDAGEIVVNSDIQFNSKETLMLKIKRPYLLKHNRYKIQKMKKELVKHLSDYFTE